VLSGLLALAIVIAAVVAFSLARGGDGRRLTLPYSDLNPTASGVFVRPGQQTAWGDYPLCLSAPGSPATIVSVEPIDGNGNITVSAFGVRRYDADGGSMLGTALGTLTRSGFAAPLNHRVDVVCTHPPHEFMELGVQMDYSGDIGTARYLVVTYELDGEHHFLLLPGAIALCPGKAGCHVEPS
jgi:hypothetical protein